MILGVNCEPGGCSVKTVQTANVLVGCSLLLALMQMVLVPSATYAESYVAGQFGATFPQSLSNGKVTQDGFGGLGLSDQPLQRSTMLWVPSSDTISQKPVG